MEPTTTTASRTAFNFGSRVLPTAIRAVFMESTPASRILTRIYRSFTRDFAKPEEIFLASVTALQAGFATFETYYATLP
jgi:hypothetical protein